MLAKQAVGKDWQLYSMLLQNWREIVGPEWADRVAPVKIAFPPQQRTGGTLTISLPRGLAMEAQYRQQQMLARINGFFGQTTIARIAFVHDTGAARAKRAVVDDASPVPEAVKAAVTVIGDDALRQTLESFGATLAAQRPPE